MNILLPDSWLREYLDTSATPKQFKEYLSLCGPSVEKINKIGNDYVYDIEITSNRVDMASVLGIAREAAAILPRFGIPAKLINFDTKELDFSVLGNALPLEIQDKNHLCDRILAIVMDNITTGDSPLFVRSRLEKSGVRSLNNCIDITNYVMLELGHPCHVFDYDRIKTAKLVIRCATKGETLTTLDNKVFPVDDSDVVIDDGTGRIIDLPGIMGTQNSVVTSDTKRIVFFIESNNPVNIRQTSMRLGLRTMAATINEKHPDPELAKKSLLRGIELYQELTGAKVASSIIDIYPNPSKPKKITVTPEFINERLGESLKAKEIVDILESLSFNVMLNSFQHPQKIPKQVRNDSYTLTVIPPSFRQFDVTIPEDIVEEVARIYGYHNLPGNLMKGAIPVSYGSGNEVKREEEIKLILKYWGYTEVYHYSFISKDLIKMSGLSTSAHLKVANPLTSDIEYMRTSLLPSMLETTAKNQNIGQNLKLFELAMVYLPQENDLPREVSTLAVLNQTDFYDIKGLIQQLFKELGVADYSWKNSSLALLHPHQSVEFYQKGNSLAEIGKIHPNLQNNFGIKNPCFAALLNIDEILKAANSCKKYEPIPGYPPVIEDITIQLPSKTLIGEIMSEIDKIPSVAKVDMIALYNNYATFKITYQNKNKNLSAIEVKKIRDGLLNMVKKKFNANLKIMPKE